MKDTGPLGGAGKTIEADETFVGSKAKNVHNGKPIPSKRPVVALVERGGEDLERSNNAIKCSSGKRLTYRRTDKA